jgi:hypothetical protein
MALVHWFAGSEEIAKAGPFKTHERAAAYLLTPSGGHVKGAFVWPETAPNAKAKKGKKS